MLTVRQKASGEILVQMDVDTLEGIDLAGLSLYGAELRRAGLSRANLSRCSLISAVLDGARLDEAVLDGATLFGASLQGATLRRASLRGADLRGANFFRANLSRADLYGARYDRQTQWPAGFSADASGALAQGAPAAGEISSAKPHNRVILVIEDDPVTRELLGARLSGAGYQVAVAANGREGFDYLEQHPPPALILLDMMMPEVDGWAFRIEQLKDAGLASIPVVVCSGAYDPAPVAGFVRASGFLAKPYDFALVLDTVARCSQ